MPWLNVFGSAAPLLTTVSPTATAWGQPLFTSTTATTATTTTLWWSPEQTLTSTSGTSTSGLYDYQTYVARTHQGLRTPGTFPPFAGNLPTEVERMAQEVLDRVTPAVAAPAVIRARERMQLRESIRAQELVPAHKRAKELLLSLLTDEQRRSYEESGWFIVVGGNSGRRYRIRGSGYAGNVDLLAANDNNRIEAVFCGHCDSSIPLGDQLLAQKVMLEVDETAFITLANRRAA